MSDDISSISASYAVTPSDTEEFKPCRAIYIGGAGTLVYEDLAGNEVTKTNIAQGISHPFQAVRILATGTTATGILREY